MSKKIPVVAYKGNNARHVGYVDVEGTPPETLRVESDELGGAHVADYSESMNEYSVDDK